MVCTCMQKFRALKSVDICKQICLYLSSCNFVIFGHSYKFLRILEVCTIFCYLKQLEKCLINWYSAGPNPARGYSPRGVAACHARSVERPHGPGCGGPVRQSHDPSRSSSVGAAQTHRPRSPWAVRRPWRGCRQLAARLGVVAPTARASARYVELVGQVEGGGGSGHGARLS
jgi:hypothetical protein